MKFLFHFFWSKKINSLPYLWTKSNLRSCVWIFGLQWPHIMLMNASIVKFWGPFINNFKSYNVFIVIFIVIQPPLFTPTLKGARLKMSGYTITMSYRVYKWPNFWFFSIVHTFSSLQIQVFRWNSRSNVPPLPQKSLEALPE